MQVTLTQAEIEQALKNFINDQINIKEGMEINIDIRATRGADGTTAVIDIVPAGSSTQVAAAPVKAVKAETKPVAKEEAPKPEVKAEKAATVVADAKAEDTQDVAQTNTGAVAGSATVAGEETAQAAEPVQETKAEVAQEAAPRQSLFSGLKKPTPNE
ncbi:hypothetical protein FROZEN_65 [Erwinia phage vB_EamP_Frozen]|uniref:Uncharacterized protein n=2 Tax=Johnsonvirus frozen TaxID=1982578 RepID=A0A191ZDA3_9CAUD|nr:hypothetical protein FROZEN_65 [Erwinia phage vB_EamP_Frozen]ANJ65194.1 hypothetical protein FROZEN_65 [Erwinia phage vB_EamP_Frozen]ANJ65370.1 hypothetical protein GUTMEISTER_57 [Erwinia phage vB_EamP_Gutmeister]